jgi:hypothetical protein
MPAERFTVHIDQDEMTKQDLAPALSSPATSDHRAPGPAATHHGAHDNRQAARRQSDRAHAGRASGTGRAYAFRRS